MLFDDCAQLAVFITPGGKVASGATYYFVGFVDTAHTALVDANRMLVDLGIDMRKVSTLEDMKGALRSRGFVEMAPASAPLLYGALKLGLGFLRSLGGTLGEVIAVPAGALTPEMLLPWDMPEKIEQ